MKFPVDLTPVQRDELLAVARGEDHALRGPRRNSVRWRLEDFGLIRWVVDPNPTRTKNDSAWKLTELGKQAEAALMGARAP